MSKKDKPITPTEQPLNRIAFTWLAGKRHFYNKSSNRWMQKQLARIQRSGRKTAPILINFSKHQLEHISLIWRCYQWWTVTEKLNLTSNALGIPNNTSLCSITQTLPIYNPAQDVLGGKHTTVLIYHMHTVTRISHLFVFTAKPVGFCYI